MRVRGILDLVDLDGGCRTSVNSAVGERIGRLSKDGERRRVLALSNCIPNNTLDTDDVTV